MTKTNQLTQNIMQNIAQVEKHRIRRWFEKYGLLLVILGVSLTILGVLIFRILLAQQTFSMLAILGEDSEVIRDYWQEVVGTFWIELPKQELFLIFVFGVSLGIALLLFLHRLPSIVKQRKNLYDYMKQRRLTMAKNKKTDLLPLAVVVIILILGILWVYPKLSKKQSSSSTTGAVTNSSSDKAYASAYPNNSAAVSAKATFFFTLTSPTDGMMVTSPQIKVTGKTVAGADVFVNEIDAKADAQGNFSVNYTLEEGTNYLIIGVNDAYGNFDEKEVQITLQSAQ